MDLTTFSQTMDIDVDFGDGNQSYQPTKLLSMYAKDNHTFNFEDTEVTFEFTRYIQQLCNEMEDAKNRIDGGDSDAVKNLLNNLIDKVQSDMSQVNCSINKSLINGSALNQSVLNNTVTNNTPTSMNGSRATPTNTSLLNTTTPSKSFLNNTTKSETSILGLLADLFRENKNEEKNSIENISKWNMLSRSIKDLSNMSTNQSMNNTTLNDRSILKSIKEEDDNTENNKENETSSQTNNTFQESSMNLAEATFLNQSVCAPLMELISKVEKKIDIERVEDDLKQKFEQQLKAKDDLLSNQNVKINELEKELEQLKERCKDYDGLVEKLERSKKENEVLDEIISDEKRKLAEKQGTVEELNCKISDYLNEIKEKENRNIDLTKEINRLSLMEKENESLKEQLEKALIEVKRIFDLEKNITFLKMKNDEKDSQIENAQYELKTNLDLNQRLSKERSELMKKLDELTKENNDKQSEINNIQFELKSNVSLNERLTEERNVLTSNIDSLLKEDKSKAATIDSLKSANVNLNAQLSLQNDRCDFVNAKLKDTSTLKNQLEKDRKDICWQINELLQNPDVEFEDLKTFLIRVEEKINSVDFKKPKGSAFIKSLVVQ